CQAPPPDPSAVSARRRMPAGRRAGARPGCLQRRHPPGRSRAARSADVTTRRRAPPSPAPAPPPTPWSPRRASFSPPVGQPPPLLSRPLAARDLLTRLIAIPLQVLHRRQDAPADLIECLQPAERFRGAAATGVEALADLIETIANQRRVNHGGLIVSMGSRATSARRPLPVLISPFWDGHMRPARVAGPRGLVEERSVNSSVRKAVFPAAGLGTRFLPATKAQPKEMLPLVDKPTIQYGAEEALASGIDNIILVTGRGKNAIEDHFDVNIELETFLEARGKRDQLAEIRKISDMINFAYVRRGEPLGLGHAVLVTRAPVGTEPFAGLLGDDVIDADPPAIRQLIDVFQQVDGPVLAVERVPREEISSYGVIDVDAGGRLGDGVYRVRDLIEKPPREE